MFRVYNTETKQPLSEWMGPTGTDGLFYVYIQNDPNVTDVLQVKNAGSSNEIAIIDLLQLNSSVNYPIPVMLTNKFPVALVAAAIAAGVILLPGEKEKVGEITSDNAKTGLIIAGGVVAWVLLKDLLEALGIFRSQDTVNLDNAATDPNSWWNPNYYLTKPDNISYTRPITTAQAIELADRIYDATGWVNDNEEAIKSVFRSLPSRAAGSFLAAVFQARYQMDLLSFLRGGSWPQDRLSDADVNEITQFVNRLPKY